jgi:hypothetical protein
MMAKTVIGFFERVSEVQCVLQDLLNYRFAREKVSFIAHQERSGLEAGSTRPPHLIAVPGVGPIVATGPLAARLSNMTGGPARSSLLEILKNETHLLWKKL